jgi:ATP-dependent Clp protease ATP-binding subunit ClpA
MRRALQKELEDPLARLILEGNYPCGTLFEADCAAGSEITFNGRSGGS